MIYSTGNSIRTQASSYGRQLVSAVDAELSRALAHWQSWRVERARWYATQLSMARMSAEENTNGLGTILHGAKGELKWLFVPEPSPREQIEILVSKLKTVWYIVCDRTSTLSTQALSCRKCSKTCAVRLHFVIACHGYHAFHLSCQSKTCQFQRRSVLQASHSQDLSSRWLRQSSRLRLVQLEARFFDVAALPATDSLSRSLEVQLGSRSRLRGTTSSAAGTRTHISINFRVTFCSWRQ